MNRRLFIQLSTGGLLSIFSGCGGDLRKKERTTVRFYADALPTDTSGNGIDDYAEKEVLKTDPRVERTYAITLRHQEEIVEELVRQYEGDGSSAQPRFDNIEAAITHLRVGGVESASDLAALELDDSTDDFSFVTTPDGGLVYLGVDYTLRTDVWLSNEEVLAYNEEYGVELDPWDADSDNDGLTDGQEVYGVLWFESDLTGVSLICGSTFVRGPVRECPD